MFNTYFFSTAKIVDKCTSMLSYVSCLSFFKFLIKHKGKSLWFPSFFFLIYLKKYNICSVTQYMQRHTIYAASHNICSVTQYMQRHTIYAASHNICSITQYMQHHTIYAASHNICSIAQYMQRHTIYAASHNICSVTQYIMLKLNNYISRAWRCII